MKESKAFHRVIPFLVCLCVICIEICSVSITSLASDSLVAGSSSAGTYSLHVDKNLYITDCNNALPIEYTETPVGEALQRKTFFYVYLAHTKMFTASSKVYAYKIRAVPNDCTVESGHVPIRRLAVGTQADFSSGDVVWGSQVSASNNHTFWYVSDYQPIDILIGLYVRCYTGTLASGTTNAVVDPSIMVKGSWDVTYTPYTEDDYLDEIYNELVTQTGQNKEIISQLTAIKNSNATIQSKVTQMYSLMDTYLPTISSTLNNIYNYLQSFLPKFDSWFKSIDEHLEKIEESLTQGDEDEPPEDVSDDEVNNVISGESDLLDKDDRSEESLEVSIDSNANGVVWSIVTDFLESNSKVFGVYLSALSLGVICLILNR